MTWLSFRVDYVRSTINHLIVPLAFLSLGVAGSIWLVKTKPLPAQRADLNRIPDVAVMAVEPMIGSAPVIGHGTVRAKNQVKIVPQVSGELVAVHPDLAVGRVIPEGEVLFEIDPTVYEARVRQAEAEVRRLEASVERARQEAANLDDRTANAELMLAIDESDYQTSKRLYEVEKVGTQRDVDLVYQKYLRQKDVIIELRSRRSVIPHVIRETEAELEAARARLKHAGHDLESTKIRCPFDARVEFVSAYRSQVVTAHFAIATLTDMEAFEISVGIDPRELRWLDERIRPEALFESHHHAMDEPGLEVVVRWSLQDQRFTWKGLVTRFEKVDEVTRTARLVVEVRNGDLVAAVAPGTTRLDGEAAPQLTIGMHCRAELPAAQLTDALLVPRHAVYENRWVYVFEPDQEGDGSVGRLGRREVPVLRSLDDSVLVDFAGREGDELCELRSGERVVVSPLLKPVVGMKIRMREEEKITAAELDVLWTTGLRGLAAGWRVYHDSFGALLLAKRGALVEAADNGMFRQRGQACLRMAGSAG